MTRMIDVFNREIKRLESTFAQVDGAIRSEKIDVFIDPDPRRINWTHNLKQDLMRRKAATFDAQGNVQSLYRPFTKQWLYFNRRFNERVYQMPRIFPDADAENLVIVLPGPGEDRPFSVLMTDRIPDLHTLHGGQGFPLYLYDMPEELADGGLFPNEGEDVNVLAERRIAVTDASLQHFETAYGKQIPKEGIFYYVYGLLHSNDYRQRYADNFRKELPRIPAVKKFEDFQKFVQAGRDLAHWHVNYETVECHPVIFELSGSVGKFSALKPEQFRVVKMKHPRRKDPETGKSVNDKSIVIYNEYITVTGIPLEAYDYVVNGKAAIDWVMERQAVTTDKDSGIVNDANLWATETCHNPSYPLELLQRVITVSLETMKIVNNLPKLDID